MGSNAKAGSASNVKIEKFEDLFGGSAGQENSAEQIINAPLHHSGPTKPDQVSYAGFCLQKKKRLYNISG